MQILKRINKNYFSNEQIAILVSELKEVALKASNEIWNCPKNLEELILMKNEDPSGKRSGKTLADLSEKEASTLKATLKQAFNAAFEVSFFGKSNVYKICNF